MSSYHQHKWTDSITYSPKDTSLVISGMADSMSPCVMEVEIIRNLRIKKRILCATSRRDFQAKLHDIMDDGGDATTHKHSLPHGLLLYLYVQG